MSYSFSPRSGSGPQRKGPFRFIRGLMPQGVMPRGSGLLARNRVFRLIGLSIGLLAILTTLSLLTFNAADPSLNTATVRATANWIGAPGAFVADVLLQTFGVAAYLVPLVLAHWAFVCLFQLHRSAVTLRALLAFPAILMIAAVLSSLPFQSDWTKPASAGGAGGLLVLENFQRWLFLPKALSTVLCFIGGAVGLIYALGLEGSLMSSYRSQASERDDHPALDEDNTFFDDGADPVAANPWSSLEMETDQQPGPALEAGDDDEAQEVYSDPNTVRVRLAENDTVYIPDSERDDFTIDAAPPTGSVDLYSVDEDGDGSIDHAGRAYGQTTYGVRLDSAETVAPSWSFLKPRTTPKPEVADPFLEQLAPEPVHDDFNDPIEAAFDADTRTGEGPGLARQQPPAPAPSVAVPSVAEAGAGERLEPKTKSVSTAPQGSAERHVSAALNEAPKRITRIGVAASTPQPVYSGPFQAPSVDHLIYPDDVVQKGLTPDELAVRIEQLEQALEEFKIKGRVVNARPGPVVTLFEFAPAPGQRIARVVSLADDIKRAMAAHSTRIAVVPGTSVIGIELPNESRTPVNLRQIIDSDAFTEAKARLPLALGIDIAGNPTVADLARAPHLLIAGTTGSGKSVSLNGMILSLLYALPPERLKLIMIDPKMLELSLYDRIPHLLSPVVTDPRRAIVALKWAVREMEDRYETMMKLEVRGILDYNERIDQALADGEAIVQRVQTGFDPDTGQPEYEERELPLKPMPYIVLIVDELADLMELAKKDIESSLQRLTQMGRAAGIHVITATQRPSVDVITGTIKANIPSRISLYVRTKIDSRTILDEPGAEQLLRVGDMLFSAEGRRPTRVHSAFVSTEEVQAVVQHLRAQGEPEFVDTLTNDTGAFMGEEDQADMFGGGEEEDSDGDLYQKAVQIVTNDQRASTSYIQRKLSIGYNRAARLIERMENEGLVGPPDKTGKRDIYVE